MEQHSTTNQQIEKVPHVRQVALHMQAIKALIRQRLDWSEDQYNTFQMEAGLEFLSVLLTPLKGDKSEDMKLLSYSSLFWGWWRNEWFSRDLSVYKWKTLDVTTYEYIHTNDVTGCADTQRKFWSHVPDFIKAGEAKIRKEAKA